METCVNCGAKIGALETAINWKGSIVCGACHKRLTDQLKPGYKPARYVDYLWWPRLLILILAIAASFLPNFISGNSDRTFAYILWAAWIALGLVAIVQKANWKARQQGR